MSGILKNIKKAEVLALKDTMEYAEGQVVSKTLVQNAGVGITLFAFAKGEGISAHESKGDAFVTALDGVERSPREKKFELKAGGHHIARQSYPCCIWKGNSDDAGGQYFRKHDGSISLDGFRFVESEQCIIKRKSAQVDSCVSFCVSGRNGKSEWKLILRGRGIAMEQR